MPENDEDINVEDTAQTPKIPQSEGLKVRNNFRVRNNKVYLLWMYYSFVVFVIKQQSAECTTEDNRT
ncbi:hypothetical protein TNCV_675501 [Trichonephila clavipes]|nr:hypothetical protein TNCV_675501 [Trichonephila clavipes]